MKQLVLASYSDGVLDETNVNKIAGLLKSDELKLYIRALKFMEKKSSIRVDTAFNVDEANKQAIQGVFKSKKIVYNVDPKLLLGMKLTDNDDIYDLSLSSKLSKIESFLEDNYD